MTQDLDGETAVADEPEEQDPSSSRRRRPLRTAILLGFLLLVIAAAGAGRQLLAARGELLAARDDAESGLDAALDGDFAGARQSFEDAALGFGRARARFANPLLRAAAGVPWVGRNVVTVRGMAASGAEAAGAGATLSGAVADLPDGLAAFAPEDGALPVSAIAATAPSLTDVRGSLERAWEELDATPDHGLFGPVERARTEFEERLSGAHDAAVTSEPLGRGLPAFLGAQGPRRYFFGAANPAELRGRSGFIGAWSILTIDQGRFSFSPFVPIQDLVDLPPDQVEPPYPEYPDRWRHWGGSGVWRNLTVMPDFAQTGSTLESLWEQTRGEKLDGMITADPFALAALLEVAGPVAVPGGGEVDADTVVDFVSNEAYAVITDPEERKRLLGEVATAALTGFFDRGLGDNQDGQRESLRALRALGKAAGEGHILIHAADPEVQTAFESAGLAGRLMDPPGDYVGTVVAGTTSSKIDYYLGRELDYVVALEPDGGADAQATLRFVNDAPTEGPPSYVIGPNIDRVVAGENEIWVNTYLSRDARVVGVTQDGQASTGRIQTELGHPVVETFEELVSGAQREVAYAVELPSVWALDAGVGRYRLTVQEQSTIRPTQVSVAIRVPPGMHVVRVSEGLVVDGDIVRFSGAVRGNWEADIRFAESSVTGRVWNWLSTPILGVGA